MISFALKGTDVPLQINDKASQPKLRISISYTKFMFDTSKDFCVYQIISIIYIFFDSFSFYN